MDASGDESDAVAILERYINMDREESFITLLNKAIQFFETTCGGRLDS